MRMMINRAAALGLLALPLGALALAGAAESKRAPAKRTAATALTAYVGKYPFDKIGGRTILEQPAVRAAITRLVKAEADRDFIYTSNGVSHLIFRKNDRIVFAGCAHRACDTDNWTVAISPNGKQAEICVHNSASDTGEFVSTEWFEDSGNVFRIGTCPAMPEDYPVQPVAAG